MLSHPTLFWICLAAAVCVGLAILLFVLFMSWFALRGGLTGSGYTDETVEATAMMSIAATIPLGLMSILGVISFKHSKVPPYLPVGIYGCGTVLVICALGGLFSGLDPFVALALFAAAGIFVLPVFLRRNEV